jgi:hypothetical protein
MCFILAGSRRSSLYLKRQAGTIGPKRKRKKCVQLCGGFCYTVAKLNDTCTVNVNAKREKVLSQTRVAAPLHVVQVRSETSSLADSRLQGQNVKKKYQDINMPPEVCFTVTNGNAESADRQVHAENRQ